MFTETFPYETSSAPLIAVERILKLIKKGRPQEFPRISPIEVSPLTTESTMRAAHVTVVDGMV